MHIISEFIRGGVREIYSMMLGLEVICKEDVDDTAPIPTVISGVCGTVSVTGKMNGTIYMSMSEKMAKDATCRIMGSDPASVSDEELSDVIGELTNMVTGNLKSKMTDQGYNCTLSIPNVMIGKDVKIEATQSSIKVCSIFSVPDSQETIQVFVFARLEG